MWATELSKRVTARDASGRGGEPSTFSLRSFSASNLVRSLAEDKNLKEAGEERMYDDGDDDMMVDREKAGSRRPCPTVTLTLIRTRTGSKKKKPICGEGAVLSAMVSVSDW